MIYLLFALHKRCPTLIPSSVVFGGGEGGVVSPGEGSSPKALKGRLRRSCSPRETVLRFLKWVEERFFPKRSGSQGFKGRGRGSLRRSGSVLAFPQYRPSLIWPLMTTTA